MPIVIYNYNDGLINAETNAGTLTVKNSTDFEITGNGSASWYWQLTSNSYHEYEKFGILLFE